MKVVKIDRKTKEVVRIDRKLAVSDRARLLRLSSL
jgi:hypothetical protein